MLPSFCWDKLANWNRNSFEFLSTEFTTKPWSKWKGRLPKSSRVPWRRWWRQMLQRSTAGGKFCHHLHRHVLRHHHRHILHLNCHHHHSQINSTENLGEILRNIRWNTSEAALERRSLLGACNNARLLVIWWSLKKSIQNIKEIISFLKHHGNVVGTQENIQLLALPHSRVSLQRMIL